MKLPTIHQMPFLRMLLPMVVGILFYHLYPEVLPAYLLGGISILLLLFPYLPHSSTKAYKYRHVFGIGLALFFMALGIYISQRKAGSVSFDFPQQKTACKGEIITQPQVKDRSVACFIRVLGRIDSAGQYRTRNKKITVYFHKDKHSLTLRQGDVVRFHSEVRPLINTNRPGGFDYATYLNRQGISGTAYIDSACWKRIPSKRPFNLNYLASDLRENIVQTFRTFGFGENEFALLTATTIGYTDELSQEQKGNFSAVGLSHLMAVSGMQTAMIYIMVMFLLGFIPKNSRFYRVKFVITLVILWVFAFITGLSPSVVRASIMLTVFLIGGIFNRQNSPFNSLAFSAFCILLYNPLTLFDIGFQLSYAAVISILIAQAFFSEEINQKKKVPKYGYNLLLMTLAAQLGTSPLSIFYFHQFPLLFLVTNLIVLPLSGIQVYLSVGCLVLAAVGIPYQWFGYVLEKMLWGLDNLTRVFAQFPMAQVRDLNPSAWQIGCYYLIIIFTITFLYKKRFSLLVYSLLMILVLQGISIYQDYQRNHTTRMLVYNQFGESILEYENGSEKALYRIDKKYLIFEGKRIVRINDDVRSIAVQRPLNSHFLILSKGFKGDLADLQKLYRFEKVILDASLSRFYAEKIEEECINQKVDCYNMARQGAFVYE